MRSIRWVRVRSSPASDGQRSGDSSRAGLESLLRGLTSSDVITHFAHPPDLSPAFRAGNATARTFAQHLESTLIGPPVAVIADLDGVSFLSSSGLAALQIFVQAANSGSVEFCLVSAQRTMLRHPRLTALDHVMTIKPTVTEARTWLSDKPA